MVPPVPAEAVIVLVFKAKVAVTGFAASIVTVHVPVPAHADQPVKVELALGDAVRVTEVPVLYA